MKGQHSLTLTSDSVIEALEDYVNRHLVETHGVRLSEWQVDNAYAPNRTITVKFRPKGEPVPSQAGTTDDAIQPSAS